VDRFLQKIHFSVNGQDTELMINPDESLLEVLRDRLGLKGTKHGCGAGECGACTVLVDGLAVDSCIYPAGHLEGVRVETIEGQEKDGSITSLQEAFIREGAVQCGFCTPGMIMSAKGLLDESPAPTREEIRRAISGNLCRCTGYKKIVRAVETAAGKGGEPRD